MRNFITLILISSLVLIIIGCSSSTELVAKKDTDRDILYTSLVQILRGKPGLKITRYGETYTVIIRGERSFFDNNEPLYI